MTRISVFPIASQRYDRCGASEWRRLIDSQRDSGLSQAAFCSRKRVSLAGFGYWQCRLRETAPLAPVPPVPFVEVCALRLESRSMMRLVRPELGDSVVPLACRGLCDIHGVLQATESDSTVTQSQLQELLRSRQRSCRIRSQRPRYPSTGGASIAPARSSTTRGCDSAPTFRVV